MTRAPSAAGDPSGDVRRRFAATGGPGRRWRCGRAFRERAFRRNIGRHKDKEPTDCPTSVRAGSRHGVSRSMRRLMPNCRTGSAVRNSVTHIRRFRLQRTPARAMAPRRGPAAPRWAACTGRRGSRRMARNADGARARRRFGDDAAPGHSDRAGSARPAPQTRHRPRRRAATAPFDVLRRASAQTRTAVPPGTAGRHATRGLRFRPAGPTPLSRARLSTRDRRACCARVTSAGSAWTTS